jgi:hypothetical protein
MGKALAECFKINVKYGDQEIEALFVPLYSGKRGWVGPGYWEPKIEEKDMEPPSFKYNTRVYTRNELIDAGAKLVYSHMWMR